VYKKYKATSASLVEALVRLTPLGSIRHTFGTCQHDLGLLMADNMRTRGRCQKVSPLHIICILFSCSFVLGITPASNKMTSIQGSLPAWSMCCWIWGPLQSQ
jgi:hypothetical protein